MMHPSKHLRFLQNRDPDRFAFRLTRSGAPYLEDKKSTHPTRVMWFEKGGFYRIKINNGKMHDGWQRISRRRPEDVLRFLDTFSKETSNEDSD